MTRELVLTHRFAGFFVEMRCVMVQATLKQFRDHLDYNSVTGIITEKIGRGIVKAGDVVGTRLKIKKKTYIVFNFKGSLLYAHRVAWLLHFGEWPRGIIKFKNKDSTNLRISNLRMIPNNNVKVGLVDDTDSAGINWDEKLRKWCVFVWRDGEVVLVGRYQSRRDAGVEYIKADFDARHDAAMNNVDYDSMAKIRIYEPAKGIFPSTRTMKENGRGFPIQQRGLAFNDKWKMWQIMLPDNDCDRLVFRGFYKHHRDAVFAEQFIMELLERMKKADDPSYKKEVSRGRLSW